jgi:hypothetical protein
MHEQAASLESGLMVWQRSARRALGTAFVGQTDQGREALGLHRISATAGRSTATQWAL